MVQTALVVTEKATPAPWQGLEQGLLTDANQGNALRFFIERFRDGMDCRPRNVYVLWGDLFPEMYYNERTGQPVEECSLKSQASKYSRKSRGDLAGKVVARDHRLGVPDKKKLADAIKGLILGDGEGDVCSPISMEVICQFNYAWTGNSAEFARTLLCFHGLGFVYDASFRDEFLSRLMADFPGCGEGALSSYRSELAALDGILDQGGLGFEEARIAFVDTVSMLLVSAIGGPQSYSGELGFDPCPPTPFVHYRTVANAADETPRAQLVPAVARRAPVVRCYAAGGPPVGFHAGQEVRLGRAPSWGGEEGVVQVHATFEYVSRRHAAITYESGRWLLRDVGNDGEGSSYGTLLQRASGGVEFFQGESKPLRDGDLIVLAPNYLEDDRFVPEYGVPGTCYRFEVVSDPSGFGPGPSHRY